MTTVNILKLNEKIVEDESITSYEFHEYFPQVGSNLNNQGELRITIENQDEFFYPSESYITVEGHLIKAADSSVYDDANIITLTNNAIMHLFSNCRYNLSGKELENLNHVGQATTMLGLLKYPDDFTKSAGMNQLWYKDTGTTASITPGNNDGFRGRHGYIVKSPDPKGTFSFSIPLTHLFGFCEDYEKVVYGFKHVLTMVRKGDNDAIFKADAAGAGKINLTKLSWFMPTVVPSDMEKLALYKTIESKTNFDVGFRIRQCDTVTLPQTTNFSWKLAVQSSPEKPRWLILGFQTDKDNDQTTNPSIFDHCNLTNAHVMLNSVRYPEIDYSLNFTQNKFSRMYKQASDFRKNYFGMDSLISNCNINPIDYKGLYPLFVFDVSKQSERLKNSITDITLKMNFSVNVAVNTQAYALVISDRIVKFQSDGNKMAIVY